MDKSKIKELAAFGQSAWLDNISRSYIKTGKLKGMIEAGLLGVTSNPTIFDNAISKSSDYDDKIKELGSSGKSAFEIYDELTVRDIQEAADLFRPVYEGSKGMDGFVSLEVNPKLAHKAEETVKEAKRLHKKVNRPNVMFKVPSTKEGFKAIEELLTEGININITLIFSAEQYMNTARAFLKGIKRLSQKRDDLSGINSVASVFVSRIDTLVDSLLDVRLAKETDEKTKGRLQSLKGKAAVANSKVIYQKYREIFSRSEFEELKKKGARIQRVLWGSTGTKNPAYSDIKYVEELIGKDTVNTMPEQTFNAFLGHGEVKESLIQDVSSAKKLIDDLRKTGIDIDDVCMQLLKEGVGAFEKSFESLLNSIEKKKCILCKK
ncbi:MAG: transaldolase [Candidatus Omnitrophica bacterium CG_4_9_14_0_2_um_filter_42_8]|nr:MAG: transaldolase [Candidatus Omnitrophica bacterium CG_4_9_14_0_2_um_filter_42_8]